MLRLRGRVIPWEKMTREQKAKHLGEGHGFNCYVGPPNEIEDQWPALNTWVEEALDELHGEDHNEFGIYCDAGPLHHDHTKDDV